MCFFNRNMTVGTANEANIQPDYIRVLKGQDSTFHTYICRLQVPLDVDISGLGTDDVLKLPYWQVCQVIKNWIGSGTYGEGDPDNDYFILYTYPNGDKSYGYACDDDALIRHSYTFAR